MAADFVTVDTGTGIVHQAPAFGEVDFDVLQAEQARFVDGEGPPLICSVAPDGTFTAETPEYKGRWVKDADRDIIRQLKAEGMLFHQEQYLHDYPFCWRAEEDPLIQYPRKSWFIRTTAFKDKMLANNSRINWLPEHIHDGRFGNFLETNVDWALSRERYWGTPLPIWVCEKTGYMEAVGSYDELLAKPGVHGHGSLGKGEARESRAARRSERPQAVHRRDHLRFAEGRRRADAARDRSDRLLVRLRRDAVRPVGLSASSPARREQFRDQFPADFISEAIDQTRGWFYSLLAISTLLFGEERRTGEAAEAQTGDAALPSPLAPLHSPLPPSVPQLHRARADAGRGRRQDVEEQAELPRAERDFRPLRGRRPAVVLLRQPAAVDLDPLQRAGDQGLHSRVSAAAVERLQLLRDLREHRRFRSGGGDRRRRRANLTPTCWPTAKGYRPVGERGELDRWILSELNRTAAAVVERMDAYDNFGACARLTEFVDALSNWYVRRSRDRFWSSEQSADKADAYWTLYECLLTTCKLIAPFVPFLAEAMWQNLAVAAFRGQSGRPASQPLESVHLCDYPDRRCGGRSTKQLSERMALAREIVSLGRSARMGAKLKVRQPLKQVEVVLADNTHQAWLEEHAALICDELNVKRVEFTEKADQYITYTVLPDLKRLGPRLGKRLPAVQKAAGRGRRRPAAGRVGGRRATSRSTLPDGPVALDARRHPSPPAGQGRLGGRARARAAWSCLATELTPS